MTSTHSDKPKENGRKVWESLVNQLIEATGFFNAMLLSIKKGIRKHILWMLIFGMFTSLPFGAYYFFKPKVYQAQMTVSYNHLEKKIYADIIDKLDAVVQSKNYKDLAKIFPMPEGELQNLLSISSYNIRKEPLNSDLSTERVPFYIVVKTKEIGILSHLQKAIVQYLDSSDFLQTRRTFFIQQNQEELDFLNERLAIMDSLSRLIIIKDNSITEENAQKEVDFNEEIMKIREKIKAAESALQFNSNIEVLDGFVLNSKPIGKSLSYYLVFGFILGLGLRLLVLVFREK